MPDTPPQTYLTLSLRNLGYTTTQSNLLSIPSKFIGMTMLLVTSYMSEIIDSRTLATVSLQFWALPLLIALYTFGHQTSQWAYFAVVTLVAGFPYIHPIQVAWASANSYGVGTRMVSASIYNMFVQADLTIAVRASTGLYAHHRTYTYVRLPRRRTSTALTMQYVHIPTQRSRPSS